jgi:hypothetical protein
VVKLASGRSLVTADGEHAPGASSAERHAG